MLRMVYYSDPAEMDRPRKILYDLLKNLPISSHLASMLASQDTKILVSALQMCEILMEKMPGVFAVYFNREGVMHQIDKLIEASAAELAGTGVEEAGESAGLQEDESHDTPGSPDASCKCELRIMLSKGPKFHNQVFVIKILIGR